VLHTEKKERISRCGPLSAVVAVAAFDVAAVAVAAVAVAVAAVAVAAAACSCGRSVAVAACFWCSCCWCHVVHQRNNFYCCSDRNFVVDKILIRFGLHFFVRSLYAISIWVLAKESKQKEQFKICHLNKVNGKRIKM